MDTPADPFANVPRDADGRLDLDIRCQACDYNLRGLAPDGRCPECGTVINRSVSGDLLRFREPAWVETLASGMNWIIASICAGVLGGLAVMGIVMAGGVRSRGSGGDPALSTTVELAFLLFVYVVVQLIGLIGYWKVTTPDPGRPENQGLTTRKLVRVACVTGYVLGIVGQLTRMRSELAGQIIGSLNAIIGLIFTVAVFTYARLLALRIPDWKLARSTRIVMWGMVCVSACVLIAEVASLALRAIKTVDEDRVQALGMGGGCAVGVASLVFGIWALVLILRYRSAFRTAAGLARTTWDTNTAALQN